MQKSQQTRDDNIDRLIETDEVEISEKWSKFPPIQGCDFGGGGNSSIKLYI